MKLALFATTLSLLTPGCAALFSKAPPALHTLTAESTIECTEHYGPNIADAILGFIAAGCGTVGVLVGSEFRGASEFTALGLVGVAGGIAHYVSAATTKVGECRRLKELQRQGQLGPAADAARRKRALPWSGVDSYTAPSTTARPRIAESQSALPGSLERGMDRPGADYRFFATDGAAEVCRDACAKEERCRAFTYAHPGVRGPRAMCFLKEAMPRPVENQRFDSGTK